MSLPDTVFIFVLALIIFGPKKLPEIGRQLGKLVGEFRRASNEFKYQIEEELRQVDLSDKRSTQATIAAPALETTTSPSDVPESSAYDNDSHDPAESIPIGQHPNIDTLNTSELDISGTQDLNMSDSGSDSANAELFPEQIGGEALPEAHAAISVPTITAAAGSQARTTIPYAAIDPETENLNLPFQDSLETTASTNHSPAAAEAEITHG